LRHQLDLTQTQMAELVQVHRVTWARWENGLPGRRHSEPLGVNPFRHPVILERIRAALARAAVVEQAEKQPDGTRPDAGGDM